METKKTIALVYGSNSSEAEISRQSGKNVAQYLDSDKYRVFEILLQDTSWTEQETGTQIDKSDFSFFYHGEKIRFDAVLIMIHGVPGENGMFQSYLELLHIPHTSCPATLALMTFDKYACKAVLRDSGISLAKEIRLQRGRPVDTNRIIETLGLPLFVKPNAEGSSFGISKVKTPADLEPALEAAFALDKVVLAEEYIPGRELTNGIFKALRPDGSTKTYTLPVTEIIPHEGREFFDYEAKYNGLSQEITPACISEEMSRQIQALSSHIYDYLGCCGCVRMDYIANEKGIYFLEVNTVPGMTAMSLVPQQLRAAGYRMEDYLDDLISDSILRAAR